jgi:hypothetical protein
MSAKEYGIQNPKPELVQNRSSKQDAVVQQNPWVVVFVDVLRDLTDSRTFGAGKFSRRR